jgi:hypothetical protein
MADTGYKAGPEAASDLNLGSPTCRIPTEVRKIQGTRIGFGGGSTIFHAWKRPSQFPAVWAHTPFSVRRRTQFRMPGRA